MLQEFDPESFQHSVSKSFTGSERSSSGSMAPFADVSGAKKWEGADLPEHPVPAGELTVLMDMVPKSLVSVISSALNQVILRTLGCFVHLCQQEVVLSDWIGTQVWR